MGISVQSERRRTNMFNVKILAIAYSEFLFASVVILDSKIVEICSYVISSTTAHVPIWVHDCFRGGYVGLMLTISLGISYLWQFRFWISYETDVKPVIAFCYHMSNLAIELANWFTIASTICATAFSMIEIWVWIFLNSWILTSLNSIICWGSLWI